MLRKCVMILVSAAVVSLLFATEKKDTASSSAPAITQTSDKTLAKQTNIHPKQQSNWSKIKELFM
jgi:hypothetical protein